MICLTHTGICLIGLGNCWRKESSSNGNVTLSLIWHKLNITSGFENVFFNINMLTAYIIFYLKSLIASARLLAVLELHLKMLAGGLVVLLCSKIGRCVQFSGGANEVLRVSVWQMPTTEFSGAICVSWVANFPVWGSWNSFFPCVFKHIGFLWLKKTHLIFISNLQYCTWCSCIFLFTPCFWNMDFHCLFYNKPLCY